MNNVVKHGGNFLAKAAAVKAGKFLLKRGNLMKVGIGAGTLVAAGAGYLAYKAFGKKAAKPNQANQSGSKKIIV